MQEAESSPPAAKRQQLQPVGLARKNTVIFQHSSATPVVIAQTASTNITILPLEMFDLIFKFYFYFSSRYNRRDWLSFARVNKLFKTVAYNIERLTVHGSAHRFQFLIKNFLMTKHNIKSLIIEDCIDEELITFIGNNMHSTLEEFTIFNDLEITRLDIVPAIEKLLPKLKNLRKLELLFLPLEQCLNMLAFQENGNEQEPVLPKLEHLTSSWISEIGENEASVSALPRIKTLTSLKLKTNQWCHTQNPVQLPPNLKHLNLYKFKTSHINSMLMCNSSEVFNKLESLVMYCIDFDSADLNLLQHCSGT